MRRLLSRISFSSWSPSTTHSCWHQVFDRLWSEAIDSPALHSGIERALARRPPDADLRSRMVWDRLREESDKVASYRRVEAQVRLQEEAEAAFQRNAWARILELVDQYVAEGWDRVDPIMRDHETVYLAHLKADAYFGLGDFRQVVAIGAEIVDRFRTTRDMSVLWRSAVVLSRKVAAHFGLDDFEGTIASARELSGWFGDFNDPQFQPFVAEALLRQAEAETELGSRGPAAALLDEIVTRFDDSDAPTVQNTVFRALVAKGVVLRRNFETAIAVYDEAIKRGRGLNVDEVGGHLASAFVNRALCRADLGDFEGEIASYQELIDILGVNDGCHGAVALAVGLRSLRQGGDGPNRRGSAGMRGPREKTRQSEWRVENLDYVVVVECAGDGTGGAA